VRKINDKVYEMSGVEQPKAGPQLKWAAKLWAAAEVPDDLTSLLRSLSLDASALQRFVDGL